MEHMVLNQVCIFLYGRHWWEPRPIVSHETIKMAKQERERVGQKGQFVKDMQ